MGVLPARIAGVSVRRGEKGLWLSVASVREDTPASLGGLHARDFITRINGRIVFHLEPEDVSRLIRNSGKVIVLIFPLFDGLYFTFILQKYRISRSFLELL